MSSAREKTGPVGIPGTTVPNARRDKEFTRRFRAALRPYSNGHIAKNTGVGKDAVKRWKAGTREPNGFNLMELMATVPGVYEAVQDYVKQGGQMGSPQMMDVVVRRAIATKEKRDAP